MSLVRRQVYKQVYIDCFNTVNHSVAFGIRLVLDGIMGDITRMGSGMIHWAVEIQIREEFK
jgi:hypothetical protein